VQNNQNPDNRLLEEAILIASSKVSTCDVRRADGLTTGSEPIAAQMP
jgi:hypothetical protein